MEITFQTNNQKQILAAEKWVDSETFEIAYGGSKGGGKSYLGCSMTFGDALIYPETHFFIARKELSDLRKHTIPSIHEVFKNWGLDIGKYARYNGQDNFYDLYNGSRVYLIYCKYLPKDPLFERFGSMQMTRGWIEEGGEIPFGAYENLKLSIGRKNNEKYGLNPKLLVTLNPKKNWVYRDFYKPFKEGILPPDKAFIQAFSWDNPYLPKSYLDNLASTKDKVRRQRLWLGNWEYEDDQTVLMTHDPVMDLFTNSHVIPDPEDKWITADIALTGSDKLVIGVWYGWVLVDVMEVDRSVGKQVVGALNLMKIKHSIPNRRIIFDADGVGGFIGGRGGYLPGAIEFVNNSSAVQEQGRKENYRNLKVQCYFKLGEKVNGSGIYLKVLADDEKKKEYVAEELGVIKRKDQDNDSFLDLISKKEMKMLISRSPDYADMLMMRMFGELSPKRSGGRKSR